MNTIYNAKKARSAAHKSAMMAYAEAFADELGAIVSVVEALKAHPKGLNPYQIQALCPDMEVSEIVLNLMLLCDGHSRFQKVRNFQYIPPYNPSRYGQFMHIGHPDMSASHFTCKQGKATAITVYLDDEGNEIRAKRAEHFDTKIFCYK